MMTSNNNKNNLEIIFSFIEKSNIDLCTQFMCYTESRSKEVYNIAQDTSIQLRIIDNFFFMLFAYNAFYFVCMFFVLFFFGAAGAAALFTC